MSLTSIYNAIELSKFDPSQTTLDRLELIEPPKITLKKLEKQYPNCVLLSQQLEVSLQELLKTANYHYFIFNHNRDTPHEELALMFENYDFAENQRLFLLKHSANLLEFNPSFFQLYSQMDNPSFTNFSQNVYSRFKELQQQEN